LGLGILETRNACNHHTVTVAIAIHTAFQKMVPSAKIWIAGHITVLAFHS